MLDVRKEAMIRPRSVDIGNRGRPGLYRVIRNPDFFDLASAFCLEGSVRRASVIVSWSKAPSAAMVVQSRAVVLKLRLLASPTFFAWLVLLSSCVSV